MQIKEILNNNNITYIEKGKNLIVRCLSPEHEDKNPSLYINPVLGVGHCFSCGFKVDIYKHFGITKDINSLKVLKLQDKIASIYKQESQQFPRGYNILTKSFRGISVKTLQKFKAFTCELSGWEGRVWFPLYDIFGTLIMFQGRFIASDLKPKYLFYPTNVQPQLFPAIPDTSTGTLIIVEGIFDMLNLYNNDVKNVICAFGLGIASKYNPMMDSLKIMGINTLVPLFDGDSAGTRAIKDFTRLYKDTFIIKTYDLSQNKDPGELSTDEITKLKLALN